MSLIALPCYGNAWLQPLYYSDQQQLAGNMQAYSSDSGAILFGVDQKITATATLGIGASYFNVTQKYCSYPNSHIDVQNYLAFLYGSFALQHNMQIDWLASGGINNYKQRYIFTNTVNASSTYVGQQFLVRAIGSRSYKKFSMQFVPQINANVLSLHQNAYNESGSGLQRGASNAGVFTLGVGFKMSSMYSRTKFKTIPEVRCLVFYDVLTADVNAITAMLIGGPALRTTTTPCRSSGQFGASLAFIIQDNVNCTISYDLLIKDVYFNNVVSLKFNYNL